MCSRYSQGFRLIDGFISSAGLCLFFDSFIEQLNVSRAWEFWLARVTDKSWEDFRLSVLPQDIEIDKLKQSEKEIETVLLKGAIDNGAF